MLVNKELIQGIVKPVINNKKYLYGDLTDETKAYWKFLEKQGKDKEGSMAIIIIGLPRSGKTALSSVIQDKLMRSDSKRKLVLFFCPESLFNSMNKVFPKRVIFAKSLLHIDVENGIVYIDEGLIGMNAKESRSKSKVEIGKALAFKSHKRIITLMNAQDNGIMKDARAKTEITIFKRCSIDFVESSKNPIVRKYRHILLKLERDEGLMINSHFDWNPDKAVCIIKFNLYDEIDWFTEEISKNMKDVSISSNLQKNKENLEFIKKKANEFIFYAGIKSCAGAKLHKRLIQFYYMEKNLEEWEEIAPFLDSINVYVYGMAKEYVKNGVEEIDMLDIEEKDDKIIENKSNGNNFADFVRNAYNNDDGETISLKLEGLTYGEIVDEREEITNKNIAKDIYTNFSIRYAGILFEDYLYDILKYDKSKAAHRTNKVDLYDHDERLLKEGFIYTVKFLSDRSHKLKFVTNLDFSPELSRSVREKRLYYYLILFNPFWKIGYPIIHKIDVGKKEVFIEHKHFGTYDRKSISKAHNFICDFDCTSSNPDINLIRSAGKGELSLNHNV